MSTTVAPITVARWWRTLINHWPVRTDLSSRPCCPVCKRRRCWPWAEARAELIAHDLLHLGPPATVDQQREVVACTRS